MRYFLGVSIVFLFYLVARQSRSRVQSWLLIGFVSYFEWVFASYFLKTPALGLVLFSVPMIAVIFCMIVLYVLKRNRLRKILGRIGGLDGLKNLKIDEDFSGLRVGPRRFRTEESAKSYIDFLRNHAGRAVRETPEYELGLFATLVLIWQLAMVTVNNIDSAPFLNAAWPSLTAYGLAGVLTLAIFGSLAKNRQGGYIHYFIAGMAVTGVLEAAGLLHMPGIVSGSWGEETPVFRYILANWITDADRAHMWDFSDPKALVCTLWCLCLWASASISKTLYLARSSRSDEVGMLTGEHEHP